ncbi:hypothetical protein LCGC14_2911190, partial [marine sediment metagenome]
MPVVAFEAATGVYGLELRGGTRRASPQGLSLFLLRLRL